MTARQLELTPSQSFALVAILAGIRPDWDTPAHHLTSLGPGKAPLTLAISGTSSGPLCASRRPPVRASRPMGASRSSRTPAGGGRPPADGAAQVRAPRIILPGPSLVPVENRRRVAGTATVGSSAAGTSPSVPRGAAGKPNPPHRGGYPLGRPASRFSRAAPSHSRGRPGIRPAPTGRPGSRPLGSCPRPPDRVRPVPLSP